MIGEAAVNQDNNVDHQLPQDCRLKLSQDTENSRISIIIAVTVRRWERKPTIINILSLCHQFITRPR